ncbi:MAG: C1 family peptidase [Candidatus Alcyoniella australis]|nr:C1 family peptidase [Candidatus Alcyoniella australis]
MTYADFYSYDEGEHSSGGACGGHGVTLVGYDATEQYWIGKNSWGEAEIESYLGKMVYRPDPQPDDDDDDLDDDDAAEDDDIADDDATDDDQPSQPGDQDDDQDCCAG